MAIRVETEQPQGGARAMDARAGNDRVAEKAVELKFHSRVPMLCECSAPGCRTLVLVSLDEYRRLRLDPDNSLTAPGHEIDGAELRESSSGYEVRRRHGPGRAGNGDQRSA